MPENQALMPNGLQVSVDWLSFTVEEEMSVENVINFIGFSPEQFQEMPNGANGYKRMKRYCGISVLYDGADNMGVHVNVPGSSVGVFFESYKNSYCIDTPFGDGFDFWDDTVVSRFFSELLKIGHLSRLDLAVDDFGANYYRVDDVARKLSLGCVSSKWRSYRSFKENSIINNNMIGHTIYFGSSQSDVMLRIYDKRLERNKNLIPSDEEYIHDEWIRWELELHKDRATSAAHALSCGKSIGDVTVGILANYMRIVSNGTDTNISRRPSEKKWDKFIDNICKLRITVKKEIKSYSDMEKWFDGDMGKVVAKIVYMNDGDLGYFGDLAKRNLCKLTSQDKEQLLSAKSTGVETAWQRIIRKQTELEMVGKQYDDE